jgi:hypothetical protein
MTTAKIFDVACKRQGTAHATHKTHIFNLSERCRNKSLTPSTECSFFANAHYAYRKMEWTHPPLFPTRNNSNPPKNRCVCFSLGIFTCLSAETRTVSSSHELEAMCCATRSRHPFVRRPVEPNKSVQPTGRWSTWCAGCSSGTPKQPKRTIDRQHSSSFCCAYFSIDFLIHYLPYR